MVNWNEEIRNHGIELERVSMWVAEDQINESTITEGKELTIEKIEELANKYPEGLYLVAWYEGSEEEPNVYICPDFIEVEE